MGEYASLTILRKLKEDNQKYMDFKEKEDRGSLQTYLVSRQMNTMDFGTLRFYQVKGEDYYSHIPFGFDEMFHKLECKYDIENHWLLCYTYDEMKVTGGEMGIFQATTTVKEAKERLASLEIVDSYWKSMKDELELWLILNAEPDDLISLDSESIYYSPNSEFHKDYVKKEINQKIVDIKKKMGVPHWNWTLGKTE